ncbi:ABC transporter substrate-binding protein [Nocardioides bigeumensis]|uniref:ABC transporter substrate-binding protein n=1 Tax=Nocardioides bigeumensis TaxID=433657 RepID=UPI0031CDF194
MRRLRWLSLLLLGPFLLAACGGDSSDGGGGDGGDTTLRVTRDGPIFPVFHPVRATDNTYPLLYLIYSNLVHLESDEKTVIPDLAESWEASADATTFTFTLADGVKWQDGEAFTVDDVAFTAWWGARYPDAFQGLPMVWTQIEGAEETAESGAELSGVEVVDDKTIRFTLSAPNADFLQALANAPNVIVPKHILENEDADTIEKVSATTESPIGTGPFKLTEYAADQYVQFEANADYFKGAPAVDRIIWKILPVEQMATQLESGDLDMALGLDQSNRANLEGVEGIELVESTSVGMVGLYTRTDAPYLQDKRVRQAMYYAIDRQGLIDNLLDGAAELLWNPPGINYENLNQYAYDPDAARALLKEAGWDENQVLQVVYWKDMSNAAKVLPIIQEQLAEVGIKVELNPLEIDDWDDMVTNPDRRTEWDLDLEFGGSFGLGPDQSSRSYGNCEGPKVQTGFQDCALAQLFVDGRATTDQAERDRIYGKAAAIINDAADAIYLWQPILLTPVSSKVGNLEVYPFDRHSFMRANEWTMD